MKTLYVFPENRLCESSEIISRKEPVFLHGIIWIISVIVVTVIMVVCLARIDDVVRAGGVVRPVVNVSQVKNAVSGEIKDINFQTGEFVEAGTELLSLKPDSYEAEKNSLMAQLEKVEQNLFGLDCMCRSFTSGLDYLVDGEKCIEAVKARYNYFCTESDVLKANVFQKYEVFDVETNLPEYSKILQNEKNARYEYERAVLALKEYRDGFYYDLLQEIQNLEVQRENLVQQLKQIDVVLGNLVIKAPLSGFVHEISSLNTGDYIFADQGILNIVPSEKDNLKIELNVPADEIGKIKKGQRVKLRFPAYPYYEYNGLEGTVSALQPDSQLSQSGTLYYVIYVSVPEIALKNHRDEVFKIKPGMEVDARIVLDKDTLLHFLARKLDLWV